MSNALATHETGSLVKLLLTPEEAATALSVKRTFLYSLLMSGQLSSVKIGRARRIPVIALHNYIERLSQMQKVG